MQPLVVIAAVGALVCATGCGSDDEDGARPGAASPPTATAPPEERARYIARADAICAPLAEAVAREFPADGEFEGAEELAAVFAELLPLFESTLADLEELAVPRGDEGFVDGFRDHYRDEIALMREYVDQVETGLLARVAGMGTELGREIGLHRSSAEDYGYRTCPF